MSRRSTTSAGVPGRPRVRLLGCRFAKAAYTVATTCSSSSRRSACFIQSSARLRTSSAISPSPKLRSARRVSIMRLSPGLRRGAIGTQQLMVELADCLKAFLQLLIVIQPAANRRDLLGPQADLPGASASISYGQDRDWVALAARAGRAAATMPDGPLEQGTAQDLAGDGEPAEQCLPRGYGPILFHLKR